MSCLGGLGLAHLRACGSADVTAPTAQLLPVTVYDILAFTSPRNFALARAHSTYARIPYRLRHEQKPLFWLGKESCDGLSAEICRHSVVFIWKFVYKLLTVII